MSTDAERIASLEGRVRAERARAVLAETRIGIGVELGLTLQEVVALGGSSEAELRESAATLQKSKQNPLARGLQEAVERHDQGTQQDVTYDGGERLRSGTPPPTDRYGGDKLAEAVGRKLDLPRWGTR